MKQTIFLRRKSMSHTPDNNSYSQTIFAWIFMIALIFLVFGLYFFWPRLFEMKEAYAPESAIRENLAVFLQARDRYQEALRARPLGEKISAEELVQAIKPLQPTGESSPRIYLWRTFGEFILEDPRWPEGWDRSNPPWENYQPGVFVSREKETAHLVLFEMIPTTDIYLVVIKPFLPVFTKEKETS
jgi:hypothetical protein